MEWKEVRLGDVCNIITGFPFPGKKYSKEGIRVVRGDNVTIGNLRWDTEKDKRWNEPFDKTEYYSLQANDIVIGMDGSRVGKNKARIKEEDLPLLLAQRVACVRHNELAEQDYLYYNIFSKKFIDYVNSIHTGSAIPHISQKQIEDYKILLPNLETQRRIATILSSLDRKIELNNKINADLEEMAQVIFKNWFVDFEPFKDDKFVDSELGMIPEGWKVGSLGDFCNVFTGKKNTNQAIEKGLYPFFSCAPEPLASNDAIFNGKAIIIAGNGSYTGRTSFYNGGFDLYQRTYACTIREQDKKNLMIFFYHMMKQFFEPTKMGGTRGSSIPYIVMGDITQQKFPYSKDWLIRFSNIANSMMDRKLRIDKENSRLSLLRDTLLPRLMSGELEVPE